jgi:hypothetical protein
MAFIIKQIPEFIQAVYNPIKVAVYKDNYTIGELFYCDIWTITDKNMLNSGTPKATGTLLQTLTINGTGDGNAVFDISSILSTVFKQDEYNTPPTLNPLQSQKNESGYIGYFFKVGTIKYNAQNQKIKTQEYELAEVQWAVRAALPKVSNPTNSGNSGNMIDYCYKYNDTPISYATNIPDNTKRNRSEDTLLSFFLPFLPSATNARIEAQATLYFADNTSVATIISSTPMTSGGLFIANVYPAQFTAQPKYAQLVSYSANIKYYDDANPEGLEIVRGKNFKVSKEIPFPNKVLFMNRLGGWDSIQVRKDTDTTIKFKSSSFVNTFGSRNYSVSADTTTTYYSSYLTKSEFIWLIDLKMSPVIFLNNIYVLQQDGDFKLDTSIGLFNYELVVSPEYDENAISL